MDISVLPSLLAADFGRLADGARRAEASGADELHLDIMDGHFVPNLSFGPDVVSMSREVVKIPLNVHLMLSRPDQYIERFIDAGAHTVQIHIEAECDVPRALAQIAQRGIRSGIVLNPDTPAEMVFPVLEHIDEVLVMSVHPGYGGQSFMASALPKIRALRDHAKRKGLHHLRLMVDGGIDGENARRCAEHGANAFVAGTFLYGADDMAAEISRLRETAADALVL